MARQATQMKTKRASYSDAYRAEALALAARIGVSAAAKELGIQPSQLYQWRTKAEHEAGQTERERALADENARLKRQLAEQSEDLSILKKAAVYFAKHQK